MHYRIDPRQRMIDETSAWLTWALRTNDRIARIPARRVSDGGFSALLGVPMAKVAFDHWWGRTLDAIDRIRY